MKMIPALHAVVTLATISLLTTTAAFAADAPAKEALILQLPAPTLKGTPEQLPTGPGIEANSDKPAPALMIAKGAKNVALDKSVKTSVNPFTGEASQITDGKKEAFDYDTVEMKKGSQWVQVDLGEAFTIQAIAIWHDHRYIQVMHDVIVQVSDDPEFKTGVTTLFNNDTDNSSGLGVGTDREYFERHFGRVFDGKGTKARYVRGYSKGSHLSALNCWQEIEVYALPNGDKPKSAMTSPAPVQNVEAQPPVAPPSEMPSIGTVSSEINNAEPVSVIVTQTALAPESIPSALTQTPVRNEVATSSPAGFKWTGTLLGSFALLAVLLGIILALKRSSHAAPLAKLK